MIRDTHKDEIRQIRTVHEKTGSVSYSTSLHESPERRETGTYVVLSVEAYKKVHLRPIGRVPIEPREDCRGLHLILNECDAAALCREIASALEMASVSRISQGE